MIVAPTPPAAVVLPVIAPPALMTMPPVPGTVRSKVTPGATVIDPPATTSNDRPGSSATVVLAGTRRLALSTHVPARLSTAPIAAQGESVNVADVSAVSSAPSTRIV